MPTPSSLTERRVDVHITDGKIAALPRDGTAIASGTERIDLAGALVLPGLVDGHIHLDKTLLGLPFIPHIPGNSVAERVAAEKTLRRSLTMPVEQRAARLIGQVVASGTTAMRSHVDIDDLVRLDGLHALLRLREAARSHADIQFVAFPQSGIVTLPARPTCWSKPCATVPTWSAGSTPPASTMTSTAISTWCSASPSDTVSASTSTSTISDPLGCSELRRIAERTSASGLGGKVAVSHAYALGGVDDTEFGRTAEALAKACVAIMSNGAGPVTMPPVKRLTAAGVVVFTGSDNIRDAWSPYGNGDMLERAMLVGYRNGLEADEDLALGARSGDRRGREGARSCQLWPVGRHAGRSGGDSGGIGARGRGGASDPQFGSQARRSRGPRRQAGETARRLSFSHPVRRLSAAQGNAPPRRRPW